MITKQRKPLSDQTSLKSLYFWNMMGSTCNAAFYMVLLMVVNRLNGETDGGIFSIGYAVAVLMWSIGSFESTTYQVTDIKPVFSFGQYHAFKIVLCGLMLAISVGYVLVDRRDGYETLVVLLLCVFKAIDAFSGVFYAQFQKYGRLDMGGRSLFYRVLLSMLALTAVLWLTHQLVLAIAFSCVAETVWVLLYDMRLCRRIAPLRPVFDMKAIGRLTWECLPLFISSFLLIFLTNLPKYTIDAYFTPEIQSYFGALFMPASVINLMSMFVFRPMLTTMSLQWKDGKRQEFQQLIGKLFLVVLGLTVLCALAAWLVGIPVLSWFYGVDLSPYPLALVIIMLGGGFSAAAVLAVNVLTVMRRQRMALVGYGASSLLSLAIAGGMVGSMELTGAALLYAVSMTVVTAAFLVSIIICLKKTKEEPVA